MAETAFARLPAVYTLLPEPPMRCAGGLRAIRESPPGTVCGRPIRSTWAPPSWPQLAAGLLTAEVNSGYRSVYTGARLFELRCRYKAADDALRRFGLRRLGTSQGIPLRARRFDGGRR